MPSNAWPLLLVAAFALALVMWLLLRAQNSPSLPTNVAGVRVEVVKSRGVVSFRISNLEERTISPRRRP